MRSHLRLAIICTALCAAAVALPAPAQSADASTTLSAANAFAGDWCPVGNYSSTTRRCCLVVDSCSSSYPALPRPHVLDPRATLSTGLSGTEQSETHPGDPDATGSFTMTTQPNISQVCFTISMSGMSRQAIAGHIHKAPRGSSTVVPSVELLENVNAPGTISQCRFADPVTIRDIRLNPRAYYVQIHNLEYPEGAIRGQLGD